MVKLDVRLHPLISALELVSAFRTYAALLNMKAIEVPPFPGTFLQLPYWEDRSFVKEYERKRTSLGDE